METRKFKLNLASLFSHKSVAPGKDENIPPATARRNPPPSRLFTPVPARQPPDPKSILRPQSANSRPARLLQLDSRVEDCQSYEDEVHAIDNQALYGKDCIKERKISNLDDVQLERRPVDEFKKLSSAIQREIKLMQEDYAEDRLLTARNLFNAEEGCVKGREEFSRDEPTFSAAFVEGKVTKETQLLEQIGKMEREMKEKDEEIASLQRQVQARTASIRALEKEMTGKTFDSEAKSTIAQICEILGVKNPQNVIPTVRKLEMTSKTASKSERVLAEISTIVCPDKLETSGEAVLMAVKRWESELVAFRGSKADDSDFAQHFRQVFDVKDSESLREAANRVFLQTHELKTFSKHLKQQLSLSEDCSLSSVLLFIRQMMRRLPA